LKKKKKKKKRQQVDIYHPPPALSRVNTGEISNKELPTFQFSITAFFRTRQSKEFVAIHAVKSE